MYNLAILPYHFPKNCNFELFLPCSAIGASYDLETTSNRKPVCYYIQKHVIKCFENNFPQFLIDLKLLIGVFKKGFFEPQNESPYHFSENAIFQLSLPCCAIGASYDLEKTPNR